MDYFADFFDYSKRSYVMSLQTTEGAKVVLKVLLNYCVPLSEVHDCLLECGLRDICEWLSKNRNFHWYKKKNSNFFKDLKDLKLDTNKNLVNYERLFELGQFSQLSSDCYTSNKNTVALFEEILPVIHYKSPESTSVNVASPKRNDASKLFGCFKLCYIEERNLTFRRRQFTEVFKPLIK